jgi:hypothetical protein
MKRALLIPTLIFALTGNTLFSQRSAVELMREVSVIKARNSVGAVAYGHIQGSPYYTDEFIEGTVQLKNGKTASLPFRYDLFQDEIEFRQDGQVLWLNKKDVLSLQYGNELILPQSFSEDPGKATYVFVQEKGQYALYTRRKVNFLPKEPAQGYADPVPDRFERETDRYYLKEENMPAVEIKNKKGLNAMMAENKEALEFIKKSKIKANRVEDLLELVKFLNAQ